MVFEVLSSLNVVKRLMTIAVVVLAIAPRMPFDRPWTIGGDLSHGFRWLLLVVAGLNLTRNAHEIPSQGLKLCFHSAESLGISVLSLLTPYLLRVWLSERINFPGRWLRGKGLQGWVYVIALCNFSAVVLRVFVTNNQDTWVIKKVGDALSFIPIIRTMRMYNSITTVGGDYPGRGSVLSQLVVIVEYYNFLSQGADIFLKVLHIAGIVDTAFIKSPLIKGLMQHNHVAFYLRILCHSILLNTLDEMNHAQAPSSTSERHRGTASYPDTRTPPSSTQTSPFVETVYDGEEETGLIVRAK